MFVNEEEMELESDDDEEDEEERQRRDAGKKLTKGKGKGKKDETDDSKTSEQPNESSQPSEKVSAPIDPFGGDFLSGLGNEPSLVLSTSPQCTPQTFQKHWKALSAAAVLNHRVKTPEGAKTIETLAHGASFRTVAKGTVKQNMKFYFFAQEVGSLFSIFYFYFASERDI